MSFYKTTLNLYAEDVETLKRHYPRRGGFSAATRMAVHNLAKRLRAMETLKESDENQPPG